jgi:RND family efflux transporter MFP subunit
MKLPRRALWPWLLAGALAAAAALALSVRAADDGKAAAGAAPTAKGAQTAQTAPKPSLSVELVQPQPATLARRLEANGNIAAWQEASIGTEANGLRLAEVRVNVGDVVKKGQLLARFAPDTVNAELAQIRAAVAEAEAQLAEAAANAQRARTLEATGALSAQQINQFVTAETTARARLEAQRALAQTQMLRVQQTQVLAPDDGVISARSATVGAVLPAGQELFRLIRQGRLEWRAELPSSDLGALRPGVAVRVMPASGGVIEGRVRMVAPTVDPATRNGLVYVDLPAPGAAKAGMFARGEFEVGSGSALTLPQSAVVLRDGFAYVFAVDAEGKVSQRKVATGRRAGERVEITGGLDAGARVVASGGGFLADGDTVRVVQAAAPAAAK